MLRKMENTLFHHNVYNVLTCDICNFLMKIAVMNWNVEILNVQRVEYSEDHILDFVSFEGFFLVSFNDGCWQMEDDK